METADRAKGETATMIAIRNAASGDAEAVTCLISELGFELSVELMRRNLDALTGRGLVPLLADHGQVIGCVTYNIMHVLHRPAPVGRISMLIVSADMRGRGIGRSLANAAVEKLREGGCRLCEVTSNLGLPDAHAFYERIGFRRTSIRLVKDI